MMHDARSPVNQEVRLREGAHVNLADLFSMACCQIGNFARLAAHVTV